MHFKQEILISALHKTKRAIWLENKLSSEDTQSTCEMSMPGGDRKTPRLLLAHTNLALDLRSKYFIFFIGSLV